MHETGGQKKATKSFEIRWNTNQNCNEIERRV
jgi:hypothetical protein